MSARRFSGIRVEPLVGVLALTTGCAAVGTVELVGRSVLPAATFASGLASGRNHGTVPNNGPSVPLAHQTVQRLSALLKDRNGGVPVMADNGYGALENSSNVRLRVYSLLPRPTTAAGGAGKPKLQRYLELRDPDRKIPFAITNAFTKDRVLTGADFDIELMQRMDDGTLWFGDEFGPLLLHTDARGKALEAPIPLPAGNAGAGSSSPGPTAQTA